jgi:hypothetical protein
MAYLNSIPPHASGGHGTREPARSGHHVPDGCRVHVKAVPAATMGTRSRKIDMPLLYPQPGASPSLFRVLGEEQPLRLQSDTGFSHRLGR